MKVAQVHVRRFRSIQDATPFDLSPALTALIGKNESGKTSLLDAIEGLNPAREAQFDWLSDFPKGDLAAGISHEEISKIVPVEATFLLEEAELTEVERRFGRGILTDRRLKVRRDYANRLFVDLPVDEPKVVAQVVAQLVTQAGALGEHAQRAASKAQSFEALGHLMRPWIAGDPVAARLKQVAERLVGKGLGQRIWEECLEARFPKFVSFSQRDLLPAAIRLKGMGVEGEGVKTVRALLRLAGADPDALDFKPAGILRLRQRLKAVAAQITEELTTWWGDGQGLEIAFDVTQGAGGVFGRDEVVLSLKVLEADRHASLSFYSRSDGFLWFFSFFVWLRALRESGERHLILLDEPGSSLHPSAQIALRRFMVRVLSPESQVVFSTHSSFMLDPSDPSAIRAVVPHAQGTFVTSDLAALDAVTSMPIRAALGVQLVQPSMRGRVAAAIVVEDVADMVWLRFLARVAAGEGGAHPVETIPILPLGREMGLQEKSLWATLYARRTVVLTSRALPPTGGGGGTQKLLSLREFAKDKGRPGGAGVEGLEDLLPAAGWRALVVAAYPEAARLPAGALSGGKGAAAAAEQALKRVGVQWSRLKVAEAALCSALTFPSETWEEGVRLVNIIDAYMRGYDE